MTRKIMIEVISSLLVLLFLYTSLSKWLEFKTFTHEMHNQPFPHEITNLIIWMLPITEVLIVLALLFEKTRLAGLWASFILMLLFTVYTILILAHVFKRIPCTCGGVIKKLTWDQHLFFNLFFVGISLAGIILKRNEFRNVSAGRQTLRA